MGLEADVCRDFTIYPAGEVLKHVKGLDDACILEIRLGQAYTAITEYAEAHFEEVGSFLIGARSRRDVVEEDTIGMAFRRAISRAYTASELASAAFTEDKERASKVPELTTTLGCGMFSHGFEGRTIYLCQFLRDSVVASQCGPAVFRKAILFAQGKNVETKKMLQRFATKCLEWHHDKTFNVDLKENRFRLFRFKVSHGLGEWVYEGEKRARSAHTVILKKSMREEILQDFENFLSEDTREWYVKHGVPRRRSYLFYGTPGSGKTSMIKVLAGKYKLNACFLSLAHEHLNNQVISDAMSSMPAEALLVLEDVDALFNEDQKGKEGIKVTFSGILNMLDGIVSGEGRLTVMTTNHVDKLDPALIRCGRVDRMFHITTPDKKQMADFFESFYPKSSPETRERFADTVVGLDRPEKKSMATLQQFFIFTREDPPEKALSRLAEFYEKYFEARLPQASPALYS